MELFKLILKNSFRQKLRSFLTIAGIAIAILGLRKATPHRSRKGRIVELHVKMDETRFLPFTAPCGAWAVAFTATLSDFSVPGPRSLI